MNRKPIGVTVPHRKSTTSMSPTSPKVLQAINAKLEAMAVECERMPFGDTAQSFAAWIRGQKQ